MKVLDTPCIGICSTIYGDEICRGCKRSSDEIITWNVVDASQKLQILSRLNTYTTEVTAERITIIDTERLKAALLTHRIRFREEFTPYTWAYNLLRAAAEKIHDVEQCGIAIKESYKHLRLSQLIDEIDEALYANASEHQRQIHPSPPLEKKD